MLTPQTTAVLAAITLERDRQLSKLGWTPEHDDKHGPTHLIVIATDWLIHASHVDGGERRDALVKAAALLVSAVEVLDRAEAG